MAADPIPLPSRAPAAGARGSDDGVEPLPGADDDPVLQLAHLVPALWRTMRRSVPSSEQLPAKESQVAILRMLLAHGDLMPAELAQLLYIARPTVSNLLKEMVSGGLVERRIAAHDARSVTVHVTPSGRRILEEFRRDRTDALRQAIRDLPEGDQAVLADALPALRRLLRTMETVAASVADDPGAAGAVGG